MRRLISLVQHNSGFYAAIIVGSVNPHKIYLVSDAAYDTAVHSRIGSWDSGVNSQSRASRPFAFAGGAALREGTRLILREL
jgi:hypothetical protein